MQHIGADSIIFIISRKMMSMANPKIVSLHGQSIFDSHVWSTWLILAVICILFLSTSLLLVFFVVSQTIEEPEHVHIHG